MLIAAYLAAHVVVVIVAVGIAMWLQGSVEWLIAKVNDPPPPNSTRTTPTLSPSL